MKLHYMGKYNKDPESLPHGEHMPGAVKFREAENTKQLGIIANVASIGVFAVFGIIAGFRCAPYFDKNSIWQIPIGCLLSMLCLFPHEIIHALCFRGDVYMYTNFGEGMLFVVGPEVMTKTRFIVMSLMPSIVLGLLPFIVGMIFPKLIILAVFGAVSASSGAGDFYNVYNAITQMPRGALTYLYGFNSYWYMPESK